MLVAMLVEEMVQELGYQVVGPAMTLDKALQLIEQAPFDCAILDINLGHGVISAPIAQKLEARGIPFLYASGYGSKEAIDGIGERIILKKPFLPQDLDRALRLLLS